MADNIQLSLAVGVGEILATDQVATDEHYQKIKLFSSDSDSTAGLPDSAGTESGCLRVTLPTDGTGKVGLNASTNTIGKVLLGAPDSGAADLAKKEDAASASADTGVGILAVRKATPSNTSSTDGDYEFPQMSVGKLWTTTGGSVAHDGVVGSNDNPLLMAGEAKEVDGTDPGEVAEGDVTRIKADLNGRVLVNSAHPNLFSASADFAAAQTNTTVQAAPAAGLSLHITDILISNGAVAGNVTLLDGSGGTVLFEVYLPVNGHAAWNLRTPTRLTAATLLAVTSTSSTTHSVNINGYTAP